MTGKHLPKEKKEALIKRVRDELEVYEKGWVEDISSNQELAEWMGVCSATISSILKNHEKLKIKRKKILQSENARNVIRVHGSAFSNLAHEQLVENGKKGGERSIELHGNPLAKLTKEERAYASKKGYLNGIAKQTHNKHIQAAKRRNELYGNPSAMLTHQQRSETATRSYSKTGLSKLTHEQRSETAKRTIRLYGPPRMSREQRSENGKKAYPKSIGKMTMEDRQRAFLAAKKAPNGVEGRLISALSEIGLYSEHHEMAVSGQLYYPGFKGNKWYVRFENGKYKLPDFKVKGQKKVIEIYGEYHHSKEFCENHGHPDYSWNPKRLIEEYAKKGIECRVYWSKELSNGRLGEIVQDIGDWIGVKR